MNPSPNNLDPIESGLRELREAESAGVFRRSRLVLQRLQEDTAVFRPAGSWAPRGLWYALAASLIMAIGVWTAMFAHQISTLRTQAQRSNMSIASKSDDEAEFRRCLAGPSGARMGVCAGYDYDGDGDVDLHDFSARQLGVLRASN